MINRGPQEWDGSVGSFGYSDAVQPWKDACAQTFAKAFGEGGVVSAVSNNLEGGPDPDQGIKEAGGMVAAQYVVKNGPVVKPTLIRLVHSDSVLPFTESSIWDQ